MNEIVFSDDDLKVIKEFDVKMASLKDKLADLYLQKHEINKFIENLIISLNETKEHYINATKDLAALYGLNISVGQWNLDLNTRRLSRTDI